MWLWIVVGWTALAGLLAWLHHRLHRLQPALPEAVAQFLLQFETALARRHPQVGYLGLLPARFACLLRLDGQETAVPLHDAWRRAQAFPEALPQLVDQLIEEVRAEGLDRVADREFGAVAPRLLPQVRSRAWIDERGCFGDSGLVCRPLSDDLAIVYVIDEPDSMVFVCRAQLRHWRKTEAELHGLALTNLRRRSDALPAPETASGEPLLLQTGDGYDAARLLLLDRAEGLLVAVPDRDLLWVAQERGQDLASLMATTEQIARTAPHPVSSQLYRVTDGRLQPLAERT